eukprot:3881648-Rhodomonas_salina.2
MAAGHITGSDDVSLTAIRELEEVPSYAFPMRCPCPLRTWTGLLRIRYALSGTDIGYAAMQSLREVRY